MNLLRQMVIVFLGSLVLLGHVVLAGPDEDKFETPPVGDQLQARDAVPPSHLVACEVTPAMTRGLLARRVSGPEDGPLPDFSVYRDVSERKTRFFDYLLPLVTAENERLAGLRTRLRYIQQTVRWGRKMADADQVWLSRVLAEYRLPPGDPRQPEFWVAVFERVDTLPTELVLVQAANESAWGTSRFAREGNNLFGQWCFRKGCGIVPAGRPAGATYEVARYATVGESVDSYMHNLNTGPTYQLFRELRARMRAQGLEPDATELAAGLLEYSERGQDYVDALRAMIRHNAEIIVELRRNSATEETG